MAIRGHISLHKKWKQNPIERALAAHCDSPRVSSVKTTEFQGFARWLKKEFKIANLSPVASIICNKFFTATDVTGRRLFIKTGSHAGIYENEYKMGRALYDIDSKHFLEPLYFNDFDEYNFFANEYVSGVSLETAVRTGSLTSEQKSRIVGDIWRIFCALRASDVVHRDVRPDNLMIIDGRLVLIDFQLAVSKSNYVELDYLARRPNRLRKLGNKKYRYRPFTWDDAYSLTRVLDFVGRDRLYGLRYDIIYKHIRAYVGKDKIKATVREKDIHRFVRHIKTMRI